MSIERKISDMPIEDRKFTLKNWGRINCYVIQTSATITIENLVGCVSAGSSELNCGIKHLGSSLYLTVYMSNIIVCQLFVEIIVIYNANNEEIERITR